MKTLTILAYGVRLASLAFGGFVMMASVPFAMLAGAAPSETAPTFSPLLIIPLAACLYASGFIYIGLLGQRMAKSRLHCMLAGVLLAAPIAIGIRLSTSPNAHGWDSFGLFFLFPPSLIFVCAIWALHITSELNATQIGLDA